MSEIDDAVKALAPRMKESDSSVEEWLKAKELDEEDLTEAMSRWTRLIGTLEDMGASRKDAEFAACCSAFQLGYTVAERRADKVIS